MTTPSRPLAATAASVLLGLAAAVQAAGAVAAAVTKNPVVSVYENAFQGSTSKNAEIVAQGYTMSVVLGGSLAVLFAILAIFISRGSNGARITTWMIGGLLTLFNVLGFAFTSNTPLAGNANLTTPNPTTQLAKDAIAAAPAWAPDFAIAEALVSIVVVAAVIVLLALPASRSFYRRKASAGSTSEARLAG